MAVSVTVLASGSKGNCTVVCSSRTRLLVDAGLSCREILRRMVLSGHEPAGLSAVLLTHEHADHVSGLQVLARKLRIPVYLTPTTQAAYLRWARDSKGNKARIEKIENFEAGRSFQVGDIAVTPFTIPHDAADPVGFTFRSEGLKVGIATDLGYLPASVK